MRTSDFVSPLHLLGLDDKCSNLRFSVDSWSERNHKVGSISTVRFKIALFRLDLELYSTVFGESGNKFCVLLHMISQSEGNSRGLLQRRLNCYDVINHRLTSFKDDIELPTTTTALVDDQFGLGFKGLKRLESHGKLERLHWSIQGILLQIKGHGPFYQFLLLRLEHVDFMMERIVLKQLLEPRQLNFKLFVQGLSSSGLEVEVSDV